MLTWQSLLTTLGIGGLSVVATVIITFVRGKAVRWARSINDPIVERLNAQLDVWIDDSINTVNKNFVDKLKEVGEWDSISIGTAKAMPPDYAAEHNILPHYLHESGTKQRIFDKGTYKQNSSEALERCLASLKSRLPKPFKRLVIRYYDDVDIFYKNRIDERIKEHELEEKGGG